MGASVSSGEDNDELVDNLVMANYVKTPIVEAALRAVDRGNYTLEEYLVGAYQDIAWKRGNLHLSSPSIYAEVLERLQLSEGQSFLNLGSGTGYLSTVVGLILGTFGINHGVEQHPDVVEYANERLAHFLSIGDGLDQMNFCKPEFVLGNCLQLEPSRSVRSYDRVYCGAGVPREYVPHIADLVKIGGLIVVPTGNQLLQMRRVTEKEWQSVSILPVSFAILVEPTAEQRAAGANVLLPDRVPLNLQDICRATVRNVLRERVRVEMSGFEMRSVTTTKIRQSNREGGDGDAGSSRRLTGAQIAVHLVTFEADENPPNPPPQQQNEGNHGMVNGAGGDGGENPQNDASNAAGLANDAQRRPFFAHGFVQNITSGRRSIRAVTDGTLNGQAASSNVEQITGENETDDSSSAYSTVPASPAEQTDNSVSPSGISLDSPVSPETGEHSGRNRGEHGASGDGTGEPGTPPVDPASPIHQPAELEIELTTDDQEEEEESDEEYQRFRDQQRRACRKNAAMLKKFSRIMVSNIALLPVPDSIKDYLKYYRPNPAMETVMRESR